MTQHTTKELYAMFLESQWWVDLSFTKRCAVRKCERCGCTYDLQAHHIRYPENWFETRLEDLEVLCRDCHEKEHHIAKVVSTPKTRAQANAWRKDSRVRSRKAAKFRFKQTRKGRMRARRKRERLQGLLTSQSKNWHRYRITPIHHYVNRGTSSN